VRRAQYTGQAISGVTYTGRPFTAPKTPHPRDGMVPVTVRAQKPNGGFATARAAPAGLETRLAPRPAEVCWCHFES